MAGDGLRAKDEIVVRMKMGPTILGLWTILVVVLGLFHHWRFEHWMRLESPRNLLVLPFWLLAMDAVVIAGGFGLLRIRPVGGRTPTWRYWATIYVGLIAVAAMALLFWDALRYMFVGSSYTM
ncbi:MAG: hypothetical protein JW889_04895 [Verrucomicrobia bacterium]|nr:hypothetical protein [Verrucomicrobiota bacterium]